MQRFDFDYWHQCAVKNVGGEAELKRRIPRVLAKRSLVSKSDNYYLSLMSLRVFQSGLKHKMVLDKWPRFEKVYFDFDPAKLVLLSDERLDQMMHQEGLIKHWQKTKAIRTNAALVLEKSQEHNGFGRWLAQWPRENIVGLWRELKKQGAHLGGYSGSRFLRMAGVDTFLLSEDVVAVLKAHSCIEREPRTIKELEQTQQLFNVWAEQGKCSLAEVSRTISLVADLRER